MISHTIHIIINAVPKKNGLLHEIRPTVDEVCLMDYCTLTEQTDLLLLFGDK